MAIATVKHFSRQAKKAKLSIAGMVVVFDSWYFAVELCKAIDRCQMIWVTQSKSNRIFFLADEKGNPTIKMKASEFPDFASETGFKPPQKEFLDNITYDGRKPNEYLGKLKIGLKGKDKL